MGFGKLRFRRSFGRVKSQFRGAIPKHFPLVQYLLDLYPATAAYSAYDLGNKRGSVTEAEGTVYNPVQRWRRDSDDALQMFTANAIASGTALDFANNGTSSLYNASMYFDGVDDNVTITGTNYSNTGWAVECIVIFFDFGTNSRIWSGSGNEGIYASGNGTTITIRIDGVNHVIGSSLGLALGTEYLIRVEGTSSSATLFIDGAEKLTASPSRTPNKLIHVGSGVANFFSNSVIRNVVIENDSVVVRSYTGSSNVDSGWLDTSGNADNGTVNGSPAAFTGQGYDAYLLTEYDQSGNGYDLTQTTAANQPLVVSGGALTVDSRGNVAPLPDGVDDVMESSLVPPSTASIFVLSDAPTSGITRVSYGARDSVLERSYAGRSSVGEYRAGVATDFIDGSAFTVNSILSLTYNGVTKSLYANGVDEGTSAQAATVDNVTQGYSMFAINDAGTNKSLSDAPIAATIVYNTDQTANRDAIEAKLSTIVTTALS